VVQHQLPALRSSSWGSDNGRNRVVEKYSVRTDESVSVGEVPEELYECAKSGAEVCPVGAITVERVE
jgi:hypothetical protein